MAKAFRTLVDDRTEVSVETGLRAAEKLQSVLDGRERGTDVLELKVQLGKISEAVRSVVPQSMWAQIIRQIDEAEHPESLADETDEGLFCIMSNGAPAAAAEAVQPRRGKGTSRSRSWLGVRPETPGPARVPGWGRWRYLATRVAETVGRAQDHLRRVVFEPVAAAATASCCALGRWPRPPAPAALPALRRVALVRSTSSSLTLFMVSPLHDGPPERGVSRLRRRDRAEGQGHLCVLFQ